MEWNSANKLPPFAISCLSGGSRLSTSKYVKLDDGTITTANYYKTDDGRSGWNVSKGEVVAWAEIDNSIKIETTIPTPVKVVKEEKKPTLVQEELW